MGTDVIAGDKSLPRSTIVAIAVLCAGSLIAVAPWGWDAFGPLRWMSISTAGFAVIALGLARGLIVDRLAAMWLALLVWIAVAASLDSELAAWIGTPDRHFGFGTWLLSAGLFSVGRVLPRLELRRIATIVTGCGGFVGLYCVSELAGRAPVDIDFAAGRLGGPFGQPAVLGAAMTLVAPVALALAVEHRRRRTLLLLAVGSAAAFFALFALLASQARAAWIGLAMAGLVGLFVRRAEVLHLARRSGKAAGASAGALVLAGSVIALATPIGDRALSLFDRGGVVAGRTDEWRVALRAISAAPIFGYGPEGYRTVFGRHVDVDYVIAHGRDVITDRAHSGPLDVAAMAGIPAALLYLAIVGSVLVLIWTGAESRSPLRTGFAIAVTAYFAQQLFLFPLAELDPLVWLLAGAAIGSNRQRVVSPLHGARHQQARQPASPQARGQTPALTDNQPIIPASASMRSVPTIVRLIVGQLAIVAVLFGGLDVVADYRTRQAVDAVDTALAAERIGQAQRLRPDSTRYDFIASRLEAPTSLTASLAALDDGLRVAPDDPAFLGERARRLLDVAQASGSSGDLDAAINALTELTSLDPNHPEHLNRFGVAHAMRSERPGTSAEEREADQTTAETAFRRVLALIPDGSDPGVVAAERNLARLLDDQESEKD